jgi:ACS family hexuronate transporter-like MFS transporter
VRSGRSIENRKSKIENHTPERNSEMAQDRPPSWKWTVCGLLLLATMLNYMDRQTLSQLAKTISDEYYLSNQQYGNLAMGFGLAFAAGALFFGFLADRVSVLWLYPVVLIGWSCAGIATGYADFIGRYVLDLIAPGAAETAQIKAGAAYVGYLGNRGLGWSCAGIMTAYQDAAGLRVFESLPDTPTYVGFMVCRVVLGFFEAGHWPCALITSQIILSRENRAFGNSILQSGAAIGAIITPQIVTLMVATRTVAGGTAVPLPGEWRAPFVIIGIIGMFWIVPWLAMVRNRDLVRAKPVPAESEPGRRGDAPPEAFWRPFFVLATIVVTINATWQLFREWLPKFLQDQHGYSLAEAGHFISAYYVATDVGCIASGYIVKWLADGGWRVHSARLTVFAVCVLLTMFSVAAAFLPSGALLVGVMLIAGAGALGMFPNLYAFTQELSSRHQGKIVGSLGALGWISTSPLQPLAGWTVDRTGTYATVIVFAGLIPLLGLAAVWLFWEKPGERRAGDAT